MRGGGLAVGAILLLMWGFAGVIFLLDPDAFESAASWPLVVLSGVLCAVLWGGLFSISLFGPKRIELRPRWLALERHWGSVTLSRRKIPLDEIIAVGPTGEPEEAMGVTIHRDRLRGTSTWLSHEKAPALCCQLRDRLLAWLERHGHPVDPLLTAYLWEEKPPAPQRPHLEEAVADTSSSNELRLSPGWKGRESMAVVGVLVMSGLALLMAWMGHSSLTRSFTEMKELMADFPLPPSAAELVTLAGFVGRLWSFRLLVLVGFVLMAIFLAKLVFEAVGTWRVRKFPADEVLSELEILGFGWSKRTFPPGSRPRSKGERLGMESPEGRWKALGPSLTLEEQARVWAWLRIPASGP